MELNIASADDQTSDTERLQRDIQSWGRRGGEAAVGSVLCCPSGTALLKHLADAPSRGFGPGAFQLVFMDIYMGELNGIETARRLRAADPGVLIVFLTTSGDFAFEAFPVHPFDYLIKPYETERLYGVLDEAVRVLAGKAEAPAEEITLRAARGQADAPNGTYTVPLEKISVAASLAHTVELTLTDGRSLQCAMTFSEVEKQLSADPRFLLCNRGLMINMDHVSSVEKDSFLMKSGARCSIRVRGRTKTVADFSQYRLSKMRGAR